MELISADLVCDVLSISESSLQKKIKDGELNIAQECNGLFFFNKDELLKYPEFGDMDIDAWNKHQAIKPTMPFTSIELFAGCGGMALGLEQAGFRHLLLNEFDKNACRTLGKNRPAWPIAEGDISKLSFSHFHGCVDLLAGGFPCQAFSYAGRQLGFNDVRGTLFFEYARAIKEIQPKFFLAENVKGLLTHDNGKTFETIKAVLQELGYTILECDIYKAMFYKVPQKRERLIIIGVRNDLLDKLNTAFVKPPKYKRVLAVRDALYKGELFDLNVPMSNGVNYSQEKTNVMKLVPPGGNWKDLPFEVQKKYMAGSLDAGGGKTGMAKRLHLDRPSLTLTCSPAQKQTERCHPIHTRPLQIREYARIQTFPDDWQFEGALTTQYKQIGNAVPVNLAKSIGLSIVSLLNQIICTKD